MSSSPRHDQPDRQSPNALADGSWQSDRGVQRWVPDGPPIQRQTPIQVAMLIACPTCRAKVDETCKATGRDGRRHPRYPHTLRLAPRLCSCGEYLPPRRQLCDACRDQVNRGNKREFMRRWRAAIRARKAP